MLQQESDKTFAELETRKLDQDERNRAQHFAKMRDFQIKNDAKY